MHDDDLLQRSGILLFRKEKRISLVRRFFLQHPANCMQNL